MNKITSEDFNKYLRGSGNHIIKAVLNLKVNEGLEISFDEWEGVYAPNLTVHRFAKPLGMKFKFKQLKEIKKYMFLRIK